MQLHLFFVVIVYTGADQIMLPTFRECQMNLSIELLSTQQKPIWLVHACGATFSFSDQPSASTFAPKLEEPVNAPHIFPQETQKHWPTSHLILPRDS
jgi:hypothetical protein